MERIWAALDATGQRDETIVVVTSDNGLHYGEHRIPTGKSQPYEESIRVPLLIAGPGFPAGVTAAQPVANVDLAPTLAAATGVSAPWAFDGVDLRTLAADPARATNRTILIENGPLWGRTLYWGVRDGRWAFTQWSTGETELYDRQTDPAQLVNLAKSPAHALRVYGYAVRARAMRSCAGASCLIGT